jgi:hypothetical protein
VIEDIESTDSYKMEIIIEENEDVVQLKLPGF